ncbi:MAG: CHAT domain-containing protein [Acidobacteriota bacterium]|nr:CHAT domain-containing protein [Acidobacteriota bacterium]
MKENHWVPLLFLLLIGGTAAAPTPEALYDQTMALANKGNTKAVLAITLDALKQFGDSNDPWVWRLRYRRSRALVSDGKAEEALALLQRPLPHAFRKTDIDVLRLESHAWAVSSKNPRLAESLAAQGYALAKEKYPDKVAALLVIRMIVDRPKTMKWGAEAMSSLRKYPDLATELRVRGQIGTQLARSDRFDEAIDLWEPALAQARNLGNEAFIQQAEGNLGWAYSELGDYEGAEELLLRAHATAIRIGQKIDSVPWAYQLGDLRVQAGDLAGAEKYYRTAVDLARQSKHRQLSDALASLASYELRVGRLSEARGHIHEALNEAKARRSLDAELQAQLISGRVAIAENRIDEGKRLLKEVLAHSKSKSITSEAHVYLAQLYAKTEDFAAAEQQFDRSIDAAREVRKEISGAELRFSFFNAVQELYDSYVDFLMARGRLAEALEITESSRAQTLEESLKDLNEVRDLRDVARKSNATILCYWLGNTHSYLWIITPQKITSAVLPPRRTIETEIDRYQNDLLGQRGTLAGSGSRGRALWRMLVEPASRSIPPGSRVIIVPHGRLSAFNFETLVVPAPKQHYWIDDAILTTASSVRLLMRKESKHGASNRLLIVGDAPPPDKDFAPLPHARAELNKVARHFAGRYVMLSGAKATPAAYRSASPENFEFLHFVAHGVATRLKPLDSAVVLASDGEAFKLYARDIAKQPLTAKLVTISSCHGAGTRTYAGEGLIGLGWAFLHAGADNVVAALWEVNDRATPDLMNDFYASLAKGNEPPVALRNAKLALKAKGGTYSAPRYWAPFLLYGNS